MAANPKETTAIIRENAADHALRPLFMRFEWTRCIRATNFHDNLWVLLLLRSQNLSYWNLNLFLDYFVIFDSGLGHSAILKQTLILGIRN